MVSIISHERCQWHAKTNKKNTHNNRHYTLNLKKENTTLKEKSKKSFDKLFKTYEKIQKLHNNYFSYLDHFQIENNQELSYSEVINRLQNNDISINQFFGRFPEMREMFNQDMVYENENNEEFPNPDVMTYEELLELEEKIGNVAKGFNNDDLERIDLVKFNKETHKLDKFYKALK